MGDAAESSAMGSDGDVMKLRLAVCGDGGVGKSALTIQYVQKKFVEDYDPTIEDSYRKQVKVDGKVVLLDILDTAGQDEFKSMRDLYMREREAYLIIFSITSKHSFEETTDFFDRIARVRDKPIKDVPIVLVGNKCDIEKERAVSKEEAAAKAEGYACPYIETSAKTRIHVDEVIEALVHRTCEIRSRTQDPKKKSRKKICKILQTGGLYPRGTLLKKARRSYFVQ
eukprot:TRINITY_DN510_c0_g1_i1.p2 TRINITY_DN510_c0_g1~~TRINITY_DN510_c0_g1_i1.p2  ORF type:complete len:226 (-),score=49.34 TRINITY_DN510_c0_g1_i1:59-736(-)